MCGYFDIFFFQLEFFYVVYKKGDYIFVRSKVKVGLYFFLLRFREFVLVKIVYKMGIY